MIIITYNVDLAIMCSEGCQKRKRYRNMEVSLSTFVDSQFYNEKVRRPASVRRRDARSMRRRHFPQETAEDWSTTDLLPRERVVSYVMENWSGSMIDGLLLNLWIRPLLPYSQMFTNEPYRKSVKSSPRLVPNSYKLYLIYAWFS